jgi:hypothetical protein
MLRMSGALRRAADLEAETPITVGGPPPAWTTGLPTAAGWYFAVLRKGAMGLPVEMVHVLPHDGGALLYRPSLQKNWTAEDFTHWHGPLVPPPLPEESK